MRTIWGEPYEVKVSRAVLKTSSLWRHRGLSLTNNLKIGIIGLGYVGLPLAVEFGKHYSTTGFDLNQQRILQLKAGEDKTCEVSADELKQAQYLDYSHELQGFSGMQFLYYCRANAFG
jgi:UDP-N-acetyl-D-mannosaminuronate dehydrogenase